MTEIFNVLQHNASAWDQQSQSNSPWSQPVSSAIITAARQGRWDVHLTPTPL